MQIQFETAAPIDVQNFSYLIVLNTAGNNQQPYAQGLNTNFNNWSYFFILGGGSSSVVGGTQYTNAPGLFQIYQNPATGTPGTFRVQLVPNEVTFVPTIPSGQYSGFEITFNRCLLDLPSPVATPAPSATPSPSPSPGAGSDCPPGVHGVLGALWNISLFTVDTTGAVVDSLSSTGPTNTDYTFSVAPETLDTSKSDLKPANSTGVQNPASQIVGITVYNTP